ncbi:MAG: hypothetical protein AB1523_09705 [Bacillota bacterium]
MATAKAQKVTAEVKATTDKELTKIKIGGIEHLIPKDRLEIEQLIREGSELTAKIAQLTERLKEVKDRTLPYLLEAAGTKKSAKLVGIAGVAELQIRQEIKIVDHQVLHVLFGEKFEKYVSAEVVYKPTKELRKLAVDGDYPQRDVVRNALQISETEYVRFFPKE